MLHFLSPQVETGIILEQRALGVDWGVDSTWCGAAAEWSNREADSTAAAKSPGS